jgi:hypothetical protein
MGVLEKIEDIESGLCSSYTADENADMTSQRRWRGVSPTRASADALS